MTPIDRLRAQARDARADYGAETARGGEPVYPAWVDDVAAVCDELERLRARGGEQAAPQKAEPSDEHAIREHIGLVKAYGDLLFCKASAISPTDKKSWSVSAEKVLANVVTSARALLARYGQPAASVEPVAWAAVHFGGRRDGKIYTTCDTREQIEAYIQDVHRSSDSLTLRARPLAFADAPVAAQAPSVPEGWVMVPVQPTEVMKAAGCRALGAIYGHYGAEQCWKAMLDAAMQRTSGGEK